MPIHRRFLLIRPIRLDVELSRGIIVAVKIELPPITDPISEALHFLRMSGTFYCRSDFSAPWALSLPPMQNCLMLHVLTTGRCLLEVEGSSPHWLQAGDLALVPHGEGHVLASAPGLPSSKLFELPRKLVSERYEILQLGGGGEPGTMICGLFQFDHLAAQQLIALLPRVITIDAWASPQTEWIQSTLRMISAETKVMRPGGETVITRLADILVIHAIRSWIAKEGSAQTGWLGALQDPQLGRVISQIHRNPGHAWTLESLASEASMSRSAFAARFTELVGEPAMRYVTRWRMNTALARLKESKTPVAEVASSLGYESEAAFIRAFKRHTGMSPGAARRGDERH